MKSSTFPSSTSSTEKRTAASLWAKNGEWWWQGLKSVAFRFYSCRQHILPFLLEHWRQFWEVSSLDSSPPLTCVHLAVDKFSTRITAALSTHTPERFISGNEVVNETGFWTLSNYSALPSSFDAKKPKPQLYALDTNGLVQGEAITFQPRKRKVEDDNEGRESGQDLNFEHERVDEEKKRAVVESQNCHVGGQLKRSKSQSTAAPSRILSKVTSAHALKKDGKKTS